MINIASLKIANAARWKAMHTNAAIGTMLDSVADRLISATAKPRYQAVAATTGVPWYVIAVIHERESSQSWAAGLAQGDPWNQVSVHIPRGIGPFADWEGAAEYALQSCPPFAERWGDWSIGGSLTLLEEYNGLGYAARGVPSPYLWAGTDQYRSGKYIADGHYDPAAIDTQLGCAALLARMIVIDHTISFGIAA